MTNKVDRGVAIRRLLRAPYAPGGSGPEAFDCYGLTRHVQKEFFGRELPILPDVDGAGWVRAAHPQDGDIVIMGASGDHHIGTYLEGGLILHANEPSGWAPGSTRPGVSAEYAAGLRFRGFSNLRFYRPE